jgi:hypothetical protein
MSHTCSQNQPTLIGIPPVAKPRTLHAGFTPTAWHEPNHQTETQQNEPNQTQLTMWKVHVAHDREHDYHDNLYSAEVAQLYP